MALIAESRRNNLWFGTEQRSMWFPTPNRGADMSPSGWSADGTLLNGGGFQLNSFNSHKQYMFEWPSTSSRQVAQLMKSFADGSFGRGLIYFVDPLIYDTNILPAMWADPSMGVGDEGSSLVQGLEASPVPTSGGEDLGLPVVSAHYDLDSIPSGWRGKEDAVFIPIPDGYNLALGSFHSQTGAARVYTRIQSTTGALGGPSSLTGLPNNSSEVTNTVFPGAGISGVWLLIGKLASGGPGTLTLTAMTARLFKDTKSMASVSSGPWIGGQGHSGCRFIGKPTLVNNTGVNNGQVSFAASFREVGSWLNG